MERFFQWNLKYSCSSVVMILEPNSFQLSSANAAPKEQTFPNLVEDSLWTPPPQYTHKHRMQNILNWCSYISAEHEIGLGPE